MGNPLLDRRTPQELAAGRQVIEIIDKIDSFKQLAAVIDADLESLDAENRPKSWRDAPVEVRLEFGFADAQSRQPGVTGEVSADIAAVCQRCLGPTTVSISQSLDLLFGETSTVDEAGGIEVWELEEPRLRPMDLVEEVLIMALPFAAKCENDCGADETSDVVEQPKGQTTRPFADLKSQLKSNKE